MSEQAAVLRDPRARAYLIDVHAAVAAVDPAAADGIMREVADHLREAAADPGFDIDAAIADLGDPALIAAGVEPPSAPATPRPGAFSESSAAVIVTVLALTIGTWWTFIVGWAVGIGLLWTSGRFSRTDKIVGTAAWPFALLAAAFGSTFGGSPAIDVAMTALIGGSLGTGIWLLVRGLRAPRIGAAVRMPRMPVLRRDGRGAWREGPLAAVAVVGGVTVAASCLAAAMLVGERSGLTWPLLIVGAMAAAASLGVLWSSRSWDRAEQVIGTVLLVAGVLAAVATRVTGVDGLVQTVVVPVALAAAVVLGSRFRAAGAAPSTQIGQGAAIGVVACVGVGGAGFVLLVMSRWDDSALLLTAAMLALALWGFGVCAVWRSEGWTAVDGSVAALALPLLAVVPLVTTQRGVMATTAGEAVNPLMPGGTAPPDLALMWGTYAAITIVLTAWMLVRFVPAARPMPAGIAGAAAAARPATVPATAGRRSRWISACALSWCGFAAVTVYAAVAAVQILVWNPLAAVPGQTLGEIYAQLAASGNGFSVAEVIGILAVGPVLALAIPILATRARVSVGAVSLAVLALLAAGAGAYFWSAFAPGMSLADTYGIGGGDHARGGAVLMLVSAVSLLGAIILGILLARRGGRR